MMTGGRLIPLRALLIAMVALAAMPALGFSALLLQRYYDSEHARATFQLEESARGVARAADALFSDTAEVLEVLANSTRLAEKDLAGFAAQLRSVTAGTGRQFELVGPDLTVAASTMNAADAAERIEFARQFRQEAAVRSFGVSNVLGPADRLHALVALPVKVGAETGWTLQSEVGASDFAALIAEPGVPDAWVVSIVDRQGVHLVRSRSNDKFAGKPLVAPLVQHLSEQRAGAIRTTTLDGIAAISAIGYARGSGWAAAIGQPEATLREPLAAQLETLAGVAGALIALTLLMAFLVARHLDRSIDTIAAAAREVGAGKSIAPPALQVAEIAQLGGTLSQISQDLQERSDRLLELNRTLEARVEERTAELSAANNQLVLEMKRRQDSETQLRHMQRLEALGQLTGGIAHDFNNMLAVMSSCLDLISRRLTRGETDLQPLIDSGKQGVERAASLTRRLLAFARQQTLSPEPVDANRLLSGMEEMLRRTLPESIRIETVLAGGLWQTHVDSHQLESALLNLAVNARDAISAEGGKLTIETANSYLDDAYCAQHADTRPGQYVMIAITDTGSGMDPEVASRAFDPFFTTKPVGRGTGLGLSQVFGFTKQSGGHVKIYTEPGLGTSVKLYLPRLFRDGDASAETPDMVPSQVPLGGRELILVVEDDAEVRRLVVDMVGELNYDVLQAASGPVALALLEAHPQVALVLSDVVMPDMNGRQLADEIGRRWPNVKVLFTTGYTRNAIVHNGVLDPGVSLIAKPFTMEALADKLHAMLGHAEAEAKQTAERPASRS